MSRTGGLVLISAVGIQQLIWQGKFQRVINCEGFLSSVISVVGFW